MLITSPSEVAAIQAHVSIRRTKYIWRISAMGQSEDGMSYLGSLACGRHLARSSSSPPLHTAKSLPQDPSSNSLHRDGRYFSKPPYELRAFSLRYCKRRSCTLRRFFCLHIKKLRDYAFHSLDLDRKLFFVLCVLFA